MKYTLFSKTFGISINIKFLTTVFEVGINVPFTVLLSLIHLTVRKNKIKILNAVFENFQCLKFFLRKVAFLLTLFVTLLFLSLVPTDYSCSHNSKREKELRSGF